MIDSTKSPVPAWKRYSLLALMAVLVIVAGYTLWTKELHPKSSNSSSSPPVTSSQVTSPAPSSPGSSTPPTTVGLALSSRDPFGS